MAVEKTNRKNAAPAAEEAPTRGRGKGKAKDKELGYATLTVARDPFAPAWVGIKQDAVVNDDGSVSIEFDTPKDLASAMGKFLTKCVVFSITLDADAAENDDWLDVVEPLGFDDDKEAYVPGSHPDGKEKYIRVLYWNTGEEKVPYARIVYDDGTDECRFGTLLKNAFEMYIYADDISDKDAKALKLGKRVSYMGIECYHVK